MHQLNGQAGFTYSLETSTNMVDWNPIMFLVNTNGVVDFIDISSTNAATRFYRATTP